MHGVLQGNVFLPSFYRFIDLSMSITPILFGLMVYKLKDVTGCPRGYYSALTRGPAHFTISTKLHDKIINLAVRSYWCPIALQEPAENPVYPVYSITESLLVEQVAVFSIFEGQSK